GSFCFLKGPPVQPSLAFLLFEYHEGCTQPPPPPPSGSPHPPGGDAPFDGTSSISNGETLPD
ncbi:hypothetical protein E2320_022996, partial [Naja naja]